MKYQQASYLVALLFLTGAAWSQSQQTGAAPDKAVAALEDQWLQSQKTNNVDLLAPLLADKFVYTNGDGKLLDKAATLADAKATKFGSVSYEKVQIVVSQGTAIATGEFVGKGTDASGKAFDARFRYTDTWSKMANGKWLCVASQVTPIKI
jgi:ketosteroid isomerase-like protein